MKLSVITINYNNRDGLRKTVESVVNQTCRDFEYIVIDGGSTDGSVDVIKQYADRIDYWVSEPDKGIYNAMNKGTHLTTGEYILFLNSGDYLVSHTILNDIIPALIGCDLYVGDICHSDDNLCHPCYKLPLSITNEQIVYQLSHFTFPHPSSFFRADFFNRYGAFDENLSIVSDWKLFYTAIILNNASIQTLPNVITVFDTTGVSSCNPRANIERKDALADFPRVKILNDFYVNNYEIATAIRATLCGRILVRCYFYIYRLLHK